MFCPLFDKFFHVVQIFNNVLHVLQPWPGLPGEEFDPSLSAEENSRRRFQHMTEITILCVQAIVEFTKRIPGFLSLERKDQIILLKTSAIEVTNDTQVLHSRASL